ncbi:hypothetical protein ABRQ22_14870 [Cellulosimicrobium sp. ES-005]|uniref:Secreted protein n=1 Tax=Cellulosimicrobium sp. ES-005 TaxID=3163031 RepID=A0AAU8FZI1_9MICO
MFRKMLGFGAGLGIATALLVAAGTVDEGEAVAVPDVVEAAPDVVVEVPEVVVTPEPEPEPEVIPAPEPVVDDVVEAVEPEPEPEREVIYEDDPAWNCALDGNLTCGVGTDWGGLLVGDVIVCPPGLEVAIDEYPNGVTWAACM